MLKAARKRPLVCATILAKNRSSFLLAAKKASAVGCDAAELRIDHLSKIRKEEISEIISKSPLPTIATIRLDKDGGLFASGDEAKRLKLIEETIESSPAFIDIELEITPLVLSRLLEKARKERVGVILSHHDFHSTPSFTELSRLAKEEFSTNPQIAKLVFQPKNNSDVTRILEESNRLFSERRLYTIFGMGELGRVTRIASLLLGGCLIYCSVGKSKGKLGQLDAKSATNYLRKIRANGWKKIRADRLKILKALENGSLGEKYPRLDLRPLLRTRGNQKDL